MTFLLGVLLVALGSVVVGVSALRTQGSPRWLGLLFVLLVPLTVAFAFVNPGLAAVPMACLAGAGPLLARSDARGAQSGGFTQVVPGKPGRS